MKLSEEQFQIYLKQRLDKIKEILEIKAKEYVRNEDRLHNFNVAAKMSNQTRESILWNGFALKHLVSLNDIINDLEKGKTNPINLVEEKIGDLINYLILLEMCFKQNKSNELPF